MLKKLTSAVMLSALAALSLVSIAGASTAYADFTIANGDPNEEVEQTVNVGNPTRLNIGAGDDNDKPTVSGNNVKLNIGAGDDNDKPDVTRNHVKLNIGASDPAEQ